MVEKLKDLDLRDPSETREMEIFRDKQEEAAFRVGNILAMVADNFKTDDEKNDYAKKHFEWIRHCIETGQIDSDNESYFISHPRNPKTPEQVVSARCVHRITRLSIAESKADTREENAKLAALDLQIVLENYIQDWKILLTKRNGELNENFDSDSFLELFDAAKPMRKKNPSVYVIKDDLEKDGFAAEKSFEHVLETQFGFSRVPRSKVGESQKDFAFAVATDLEDQMRHTDYWLYNPETDKWIPIDFSINPHKMQDYAVSDEQHLRNLPRLVYVEKNTIRAAGKIERATPDSSFVQEVWNSVAEVLK